MLVLANVACAADGQMKKGCEEFVQALLVFYHVSLAVSRQNLLELEVKITGNKQCSLGVYFYDVLVR